MAGSGPPPNPNARRTNDREAGFTILHAGRTGPTPELPMKVCDATKSAWATWWKSPQATQWVEADLPSLYLMAICFDSIVSPRDDEAALSTTAMSAALSEFRQWVDRFGLAPLARLKNRWLVVDEDAESKAADAESTVVSLRVVK